MQQQEKEAAEGYEREREEGKRVLEEVRKEVEKTRGELEGGLYFIWEGRRK